LTRDDGEMLFRDIGANDGARARGDQVRHRPLML
jgi:hypothetical protein